MERLWQLATSIFVIVASFAVFLTMMLFSGGSFTVLGALLMFGGMFGMLAGVVRGIWVICAYHRDQKKQKKTEAEKEKCE